MTKKPQYKVITEKAWRQIMPELISKCLTLLDSSEKLLDNNGDEALCAGLYTYAVEEYGKLLLLKKYSPISGKVTIKYRKEYCEHNVKFNEAITSLPSDCISLRQGFFDPVFFDPAFFDTESVIADFKARTAIFYVDFNKAGDDTVAVPPIDKGLLKKAITVLREVIAKTALP